MVYLKRDTWKVRLILQMNNILEDEEAEEKTKENEVRCGQKEKGKGSILMEYESMK